MQNETLGLYCLRSLIWIICQFLILLDSTECREEGFQTDRTGERNKALRRYAVHPENNACSWDVEGNLNPRS